MSNSLASLRPSERAWRSELYPVFGLADRHIYPVRKQQLTALPLRNVLGGVFSLNPSAAENALGAMLMLLISLPVLLAIQWARQNILITALQHEKSLAELDLLKQQLNPYFFFSTLQPIRINPATVRADSG